jgi:hypothetical protein
MMQLMANSTLISPRTARSVVHPDGALNLISIDVEGINMRLQWLQLALAAHEMLTKALAPFGYSSTNLGELIREARQHRVITGNECELLHRIRCEANAARHIFE